MSPVVRGCCQEAQTGVPRTHPPLSQDIVGQVQGSPEMREERRVVTALFADMVGSTALGERLDPEDSREIVGRALALMVRQVEGLDGVVKDLAGDGVLALFGAPIAHDDDAERAIVCGLQIIRSVEGLADEVRSTWGIRDFGVRVGVETGTAVLGPIGGGARIEYGATGDVINTAARLQSAAEPGAVLVGDFTRRIVEHRFEWGPRREFRLKGKQMPIAAAVALRVVASRRVERSLRAPTVGRSEELSEIDSAITRLSVGSGSALVLVGEPGIGKSRLVDDCRGRVANLEGARWLQGDCRSYAAAIPYLPFRNLLDSWLGISPGAADADAHAAVETVATGLSPDAAEALRAAEPDMLGSHPIRIAEAQEAQEVQEHIFDALRTLFATLAAEHPLVISLEDIHWSDATSLTLTQHLAPLVVNTPLLLVITARHGEAAVEMTEALRSSVGDRLSVIEVHPLASGADGDLLGALLPRNTLPPPLAERILELTDGNPFFLEQQIRALVEAGALVRDANGWRFIEPAPDQLPATIEHALLTRIDKLTPRARDQLVAASVLGATFDAQLAADLVSEGTTQSIADLERAEFIEAAAEGATTLFRFRHALVQAVAYSTLLRRQRRELHGRAADVLARQFADRLDDIRATLADHLALAGRSEESVVHLAAAAERAAALFANREAAELYQRALSLLERTPTEDVVPPESLLRGLGMVFARLAHHEAASEAFRSALARTPSNARLEQARLHLLIGDADQSAHEYDAAGRQYLAAEELTQATLKDGACFDIWLEAQIGKAGVLYMRGQHAADASLLEDVRPEVEARGTDAQRISFYRSVLFMRIRRDRFVIDDESMAYARRVYEAERDDEDPETYAWAPFQLGFVLLWRGALDEAEVRLRQAVENSRATGDATLESRGLTYLMVLARQRGDVEEARILIAPVLDLAHTAGLDEYVAMALATDAWIAFRDNDLAMTIARSREALDTWASVPNRYPFDWMAALPAVAASLARGDQEASVRFAEATLADDQQPLADQLDESLRIAVAKHARGDREGAVKSLGRAITIARGLGYL